MCACGDRNRSLAWDLFVGGVGGGRDGSVCACEPAWLLYVRCIPGMCIGTHRQGDLPVRRAPVLEVSNLFDQQILDVIQYVG